MALRNIVQKGDSVLTKKCRLVTDFNTRLHTLLDDIKETLAESGGVGLAAPQVGVLRRAVIVLETNVEDGVEEYMIELINPKIIEADSEQEGPEGCLSIPGKYAMIKRPYYVKVRAQDRNGQIFEVEGEGVTARCFCHEIDHLDGILFTDLADRLMTDAELAEYYGEREEEVIE